MDMIIQVFPIIANVMRIVVKYGQTLKQGTLCLSENECTDDFHCVSDKCIIPNGQWLGTCQQDYSSVAGYMSHHFLIRI